MFRYAEINGIEWIRQHLTGELLAHSSLREDSSGKLFPGACGLFSLRTDGNLEALQIDFGHIRSKSSEVQSLSICGALQDL